MIVLDTCVLIAFADPAHAFHREAEDILARTDKYAISALTGAELMVHPPVLDDRWPAFFQAMAIEVVPITATDMAAIAQTRRESGLKMPDAVVLWLATSHRAALASFDQKLLDRAELAGLTTVR